MSKGVKPSAIGENAWIDMGLSVYPLSNYIQIWDNNGDKQWMIKYLDSWFAYKNIQYYYMNSNISLKMFLTR